MSDLFEQLLPAVLRVIRQHGGGDELQADVLLRFSEALRRLRPEVQDKPAYVEAAARRAAVAHRKRARRTRQLEPKSLPASELQRAADPKTVNRETKEPTWARALAAKDEYEAMVRRLSPEDQRTFRLHFEDGHDAASIANLTGQPLRTVRSLLKAWKKRAI